jgi:hypothetical protein
LAAGSAKTWHAITSAGEGDDMMLKVSGVAAQDFGGPTTTLVPLLREGRLGPNDRRLLEKRAGVDFMSALRRVKLAEDEVPIHTIALGATEFYGANRNGDGFRDRPLEEYTHTFEKLARFYRNHLNKNPEKSYGRIIKSAYNRPMHRTDLLVGLNGSEKTAEINGGLVADKELELLHKDIDIPTSMACKVAYDVCSGCGNKARTRAEYCSGYGQCKYGGLKHNITVTFDDGHQLHADNPEPYWFDESHVYKPADRIAWSLGALLPLEKSASVRPMGGAELAEAIGLAAPIELLIDPALPRRVQAQVKLAHDLAERESGAAHDTWGYAFVPESRQSIRDLPDVHSSPSQLGRVLRALASEKVALSVHDFLALMIDKHAAATVAVDVGAQLPGIFGRLARDPDLEDMLRSSPYNPADEVPDTKLRRWAATLVPEYGLGRKEAEARVTRACVQCRVPRIRAQTDETVKEAADHGGAEKLARQYALYQLAFLSAVGERDEAEIPLTSTLLVRQNHVF